MHKNMIEDREEGFNIQDDSGNKIAQKFPLGRISTINLSL
jgi:hypothetical protein